MRLSKPCIFFRVDGNRKIGLGHISRCLALAELLSNDFEIVFAICEPDPQILNFVGETVGRIVALSSANDIDQFNNELVPHLTGSEIVVLDGYHFTTAYECCVKRKSAAVIAIDDIPTRHFLSDGVINFCGAVRTSDYSKEFYTQLYLGLDYVFLRSPFLRSQAKRKATGNLLLLNMGGADPSNETKKILKEILDSGYNGEIVVVIGQSYQFKESLITLIKSKTSITLEQGLSAEGMFNAMKNCTMAILPPSTVALEYLSTGGLLFLNRIAENQRCMQRYLIDEKLAFDYYRFSEFARTESSDIRSSALANFIHGSSLHRVKNLFTILSISTKLKFRKVVEGDMSTVYDWVNEPEVRKYSYTKSEIRWEDHLQWFKTKVNDLHCHYFIAEIDSAPVAQIRFDFSEEDQGYILSYLIGKNWRGKGLAGFVLTKGILKLKELQSVSKIVGYVQNSNIPSIKVFDRAGFQKKETLKYPDSCKFELSF